MEQSTDAALCEANNADFVIQDSANILYLAFMVDEVHRPLVVLVSTPIINFSDYCKSCVQGDAESLISLRCVASPPTPFLHN